MPSLCFYHTSEALFQLKKPWLVLQTSLYIDRINPFLILNVFYYNHNIFSLPYYLFINLQFTSLLQVLHYNFKLWTHPLTLKRHWEPQGLDLLGITQTAGATVNGLGSVLGLLVVKRCAHSMHPMRCPNFVDSSIWILGSLCAWCGASARWTLAVCPCAPAWFFLCLLLGLRCAEGCQIARE